MKKHVLVVIAQPEEGPLPSPGWQTTFVLTRENTAEFTNFVAAEEPDLIFLDPATGQVRLVCAAEWLLDQRSPAQPAPRPAPAVRGEFVIGPPRLGRWSLSPEKRQVFRPDGRSCGLTSTEYDLLLLLLRRGHKPASRMEISLPVLGRPHRPGDRAVDILIHKLRTKLDIGAIVTVRGAGYAFAALPDTAPQPEASLPRPEV